jgi:hypothetical protein
MARPTIRATHVATTELDPDGERKAWVRGYAWGFGSAALLIWGMASGLLDQVLSALWGR